MCLPRKGAPPLVSGDSPEAYVLIRRYYMAVISYDIMTGLTVIIQLEGSKT